jgi:hypothetical protein
MTSEIQTVDDFLTALRRQLKPLPAPEREDILRELEVRLRDVERQGFSMFEIQQRFGSPRSIANQCLDALYTRRAAVSWSPYLLLRVMIRLAIRGVFGGFACFCLFLGYAAGGVLVLCALTKAILPDHAGVWVGDDGHLISTGLQFYPPPLSAHEIMGWTFIPVALILGAIFLLLTTLSARTLLRTLMRPLEDSAVQSGAKLATSAE